MNPRMRDYMMNENRRMMNGNRGMRDGRNPYGSRGGYVTTRRPGRRDRAERDYADYERGNRQGRDYADYERGRQGRDYADYERDYGYDDYYMPDSRYYSEYDDRNYQSYPDSNSGTLSGAEIENWKHELCEHLEKNECEMLSDAKIIKRAKEVGVKFDNFTEEELCLTTVIMFSDYGKTLGKANIDLYIKLAGDFLNDPDARVKYGEKLAVYHDHIADV